MKKVVLFSAFMVLTSPVMAADYMEKCMLASKTAKTIMKARQVGVPASELLAAFQKNGSDIPIVRDMTIQAYAQPRFSTVEYQQRAVEEYGNSWLVKCMRVYQKAEQ